MWRQSIGNRRSSEKCPHDNVQTSASAGLQRRVCLDCGHVAIAYVSDVVDTTWLDRQSKSAPASVSSSPAS